MIQHNQILMAFILFILIVTCSSEAYSTGDDEVSLERHSIVPMSETEKAMVKTLVDKDFEEFRSNTRNWSFVYHLFLFGAAILSVLAALLLKLEGTLDIKKRNNWGAALAATSALLLTIMTSGGFQRKWEGNRIAAFQVRNLQFDLDKSTANRDRILERLQQINTARNQVIVGLADATTLDKQNEERK